MTQTTDRFSARVVVIDDDGHVLLCRIDDPHDDKLPVWITPGGGVEGGETIVQAAVRELLEETGHVVDAQDLGHPVAVCRGTWEFHHPVHPARSGTQLPITKPPPLKPRYTLPGTSGSPVMTVIR